MNIPQTSSCTIAVLSLLGIVGVVFTLQRTKTDSNVMSPGMHMPLSALSLMFPLLFHFPFLSNTLSSLYLCGEEAISVGKRPFWSPAKPPFQAQAELSTFSGRAVHT